MSRTTFLEAFIYAATYSSFQTKGQFIFTYTPNLINTYFGYELNLVPTKIELKIIPYDICVSCNI